MNIYNYYQSAEEVAGTSVIHLTMPKGITKNKETARREREKKKKKRWWEGGKYRLFRSKSFILGKQSIALVQQILVLL